MLSCQDIAADNKTFFFGGGGGVKYQTAQALQKLATSKVEEKQKKFPHGVELHLSGLTGRANQPDTQKIRIIGFCF
jgi:hypothetical protein